MAKTWRIKELATPEVFEQFPELSSLQVQLLYNLGLTQPSQVEWFLNPDYHNLYDPFLFTQMDKAVDRIWEAIEKQQKILIYGDYDADAVTANAVLTQTFRHLGVQVESYIPDRFTEGYGLNVEAFQKFKEQNIDVVITVDCGTNSVAEADFCLANNIDLIITDHHEITGALPKAYALINPKNPEEVYPDKQITGVGVAYKLAKALLSNDEKVMAVRGVTWEKHVPEWDKWLLDLVAIGTVADCHSLLGENRILVKFGLKVLQKTKWLGLRLLIENAGLDLAKKHPDTVTLGFTIAPRINAAGRLEHANIALQLLIAEDYGTAIDLANQIEEINRRRQDITARIVSEAKERAEQISDRKIIMLKDPSWQKGVVGIVAGKLADHYKRPVIILEEGENGEVTGSARSALGFDIVSALISTQSYLKRYGGHKEAAGLTLHLENFDEFYLALLKHAEQNWPEQISEPILELDAELKENDLTLDGYTEVEALEPFGVGNPKPKFLISHAKLAAFRLVGQNSQHLQMQLVIGETILDCIGFSMAYKAKDFSTGLDLSVAGELMVDQWNGTKKLKLRVLDVKIDELQVENLSSEYDTEVR